MFEIGAHVPFTYIYIYVVVWILISLGMGGQIYIMGYSPRTQTSGVGWCSKTHTLLFEWIIIFSSCWFCWLHIYKYYDFQQIIILI